MPIQIAREEYMQALKLGQKEHKALLAAGKDPGPAVLEALLPDGTGSVRELGVLEIPAGRIVGTTTAGRTGAFTAGFYPLLDPKSEFAAKWINLCEAHLGETGIRDPILCYEYLGNFYIQEGNKRFSVLKHFGAPLITAQVRRVEPPVSQEPRILAYREFLDFYNDTKLYQIQFRRPGDYAKLLSFLGKEPGEEWTERERRTFSAYYRYFQDALGAQGKDFADLLPEEALLLWLKVYPFRDLGELSGNQLKKTVASLKEDLLTLTMDQPVEVRLEPVDPAEKKDIISRIISSVSLRTRVAFVHPLDPECSEWIAGHDKGRQYLEEALGDKIEVFSYFHADSHAQAEALMEKAVAHGADVVFTTTPQLGRPTLRMAVKYPKVRFLNCAVNLPYSSVRSYYGRIYEAKFITGAIAGAMSRDGRIGYVGNSPIWGVPASINAFALGAQMTNPDARVVLRWSCLPGSPQMDFFEQGIRVISNRDVPTQENKYMDGLRYGTYLLEAGGTLQTLASPCWVWGKFYEKAVRAILAGSWDKDKQSPRALNYWLGMDSGLIDISLSEKLPEGVRTMARILRQGLQSGTIDPFRRVIRAQDGTEKNDGSRTFTAEELLRMDWLCENVEGTIPEFDQILPVAQRLVREQGVFSHRIPLEKEGSL